MYFDSVFNPYQGSPSAFTSPGIDPKMIAMLMMMQNAGQGAQPNMGGPQMPQPPQQQPGGGPPNPPPQMPQMQGQQPPQGQGIMQQIMSMDPAKLRAAIMQMRQQQGMAPPMPGQ